ncbi:NADP-dependent oxidoreductase [Sphingobium sp. DC-2]|uniref:MDR family NADP-dependent oxidoreductase n=1 Tax=Sphingobium sp. DC-2 TaxID=1303256 RepID=UPI0009DFD26F|nr:NADP-dependent oxidoreductase [Sphingobium sp. DC-2]
MSMPAADANRVLRVARPIDGFPVAEDFAVEPLPMPEIGDRELLVRTIYISIAPGVRPLLPYKGEAPDVAQGAGAGRVGGADDDVPNPTRIGIGERMRSGIVPSMSKFAGGTVGEVIQSRHPDYAPGDFVFGGRYCQLYEAIHGDASIKLDPAQLPIEADLGLLGRSAFTGWCGYRRVADPKAGETIVVSSAAGAVGMMVVQLAKREGLDVIGIASGASKCDFVQTLGARACIDRKAEDVGAALDRLAPAGVDIYFDNAGGFLQRPVFDRLKPFGRLIVCGMAAEYGGAEQSVLPTGTILGKRLRVQGFVVLDYEDDYPAFREEVVRLWREGSLAYRQQLYQGLEEVPQALADCLSGQSGGGKLLVQVSPDTSVGGRGP